MGVGREEREGWAKNVLAGQHPDTSNIMLSIVTRR